MAEEKSKNGKMRGLALGALLACVLGAWNCALRDGSGTGGDGQGLVVSVKDSSTVDLSFDDLNKTVFIDSGEFDLDAVRKHLDDKGISLASVQVTGLEVNYDDSTVAFLKNNQGVHFLLEIFVKDTSDTGEAKRALKTAGVDSGTGLLPLAFDPATTAFNLNSNIFADTAGYPELLASIKDTSKKKLFVIAKLTMLDPLKTTGPLRLNMVVTVAGKI